MEKTSNSAIANEHTHPPILPPPPLPFLAPQYPSNAKVIVAVLELVVDVNVTVHRKRPFSRERISCGTGRLQQDFSSRHPFKNRKHQYVENHRKHANMGMTASRARFKCHCRAAFPPRTHSPSNSAYRVIGSFVFSASTFELHCVELFFESDLQACFSTENPPPPPSPSSKDKDR